VSLRSWRSCWWIGIATWSRVSPITLWPYSFLLGQTQNVSDCQLQLQRQVRKRGLEITPCSHHRCTDYILQPELLL
jgi:hypothetical protein